MAGLLERKVERRLARAARRRRGLPLPAWIGRAVPEESLKLCLDPHLLTGGNDITLLKNGSEAFPAMLSAIREARETICLESYIFRSDRTGRNFAEALASKAKQGIEVLLIYDAVGSRGSDNRMFSDLKAAGVRTLEYHPVFLWHGPIASRHRRGGGWAWWNRDHRKLLAVDSRIGFTGGINICDDHADPSEGGGGWRDTDIRIEGPAVREIQRLFLSTWRDEGGEKINERKFLTRAESAGDSVVAVLGTRELRSRRIIRKAYLHAIKSSRRSVCIANAYFVPDRGILRAVRNAVGRRVSFRILLSSKSDAPPVHYAGRALYYRLLKWGVRIWEWQGPILHAKTAVVDGTWSTIGSYNMDHRSVFHNLELNVNVLGAGFGARMEEMFEEDLKHSKEITLSEWRARSWTERLLEQLFYTFRHLL